MKKKQLQLNYKLNEIGITPTYATDGSAGLDLYYPRKQPLNVLSGESAEFDTGVSVEIPEGYVGLVFIRSGIGFKYEISLSNSVGVIDSDFRGSIKVKLRNHGNFSVSFEKGDRIAQLVILPYERVELNRVFELEETERGERGIGSTGK